MYIVEAKQMSEIMVDVIFAQFCKGMMVLNELNSICKFRDNNSGTIEIIKARINLIYGYDITHEEITEAIKWYIEKH